MAVEAAQANNYLEEYDRFEKRRVAEAASWITPVRKAAIAGFAELGFPTTHHEEWRFTNVAPITGVPFRLMMRQVGAVTREDLRPYLLPEAEGRRLVFVDGYYAPELSSLSDVPAGVTVAGVSVLRDGGADGLAPHLGRYADYRGHAFTALNTAFLDEVAFVRVPKRMVVKGPIQVLFVSSPGGDPTVSHPRALILAEAESQATIVESYAGLGDGSQFTNAVTELVAGENSVVDHYRMQEETETTHHIAMIRLQQGRSSNLTSHVVTAGGAIVRNEVHAVLDGEGCECVLNGLFLEHGRQHVDNHLRVEHARPHGNSREFYKGILDGQSRGVFSGRIVVHKGAQKTDAKQTNMNLLLSEGSQIDSKPQLEIFADDVKCTHGATIGQVDEDAVFYLKSRGIGAEAARSLLVYAFAAESIGRIAVPSIRRRLREVLFARLPQGHLFEEETV